MYPKEGEVGKFKMVMHRGTRSVSEYCHEEFANDPGDYGRGEYWTDNENMAALYGSVESKLIELENVFHIPQKDVLPLIEEYKTCKIHEGCDVRLNGATKLTEMFKSKGYKAVLTVGYEDYKSLGLCIFQA